MAENDDVVFSCLVFAFDERPAKRRPDAENVEEMRGTPARPRSCTGSVDARQRHRAAGAAAMKSKRCCRFAQSR